MGGRFSPLRFIAVVVAIGAATTGLVAVGRSMVAAPAASADQPWFAPYVDVTLVPEDQFQDAGTNPSNNAVLGFIVGSREGRCVPTWGTYYGLSGAAKALDLDRRIIRLAQRGGQVIVSFGGEANTELAVDCSEPDLVRAYSDVIRRYHVRTIDFDIEGAALSDSAANLRRALAIRQLQATASREGHQLSVWLTLPVAPDGLPDAALSLVQGTLAHGVDLSGVNLMTMDYGTSGSGPLDMVSETTSALVAAESQLAWVYQRAGMPLTPTAIWRRMGMTPMIGQNDVLGEVVSVGEAQQLLAFAQRHGLGRVSIWSLNRDSACGAQLGVGVVSNLCSGVAESPLAFSYLFDRLSGRLVGALAPQSKPTTLITQTPDDAATSPYPIWSATAVYRAGDQVTWHHEVFQAKWYSVGDNPDAPVAHEWDTPWMYVGPVLPGDKPVVTPLLKAGVYPVWSAGAVYNDGQRVELNGIAYQAQWWTQGNRPDPTVAEPWDSPWLVVKR